MVLHVRPSIVRLILVLVVVLYPITALRAENVAPGAHWGAIDFPDRDPTMIAGYTLNRFTEFNESRARFNAIRQSTGFNFASFSWTDRIKALPGWSGNLTVGAGPSGEHPGRDVQTGFHRWIGNNPVPVDQTRADGDFMLGGSLTRWSKLFSSRDTGFVSLGGVSGSLYHEVYGRVGLRQVSLAELMGWMLPDGEPAILREVSRFVRFSAMGRYSRLYGGSAYPSDVITSQSYLGQVSMSIADYGTSEAVLPRWEIEFAATIDSGLFASFNGHGIERRFGSIALHFPYGTVEAWDDVVGRTDSGPTFGFRLMLNMLQLQDLFAGREER